jgi:UDP-N-acetylmuramyl pentapeptide phosphotransferase/UDP-N-acetylglucosamine-1-phosphate transferase
MSRPLTRASGAGALVARAALAWIRADRNAFRLERTNFHGRTVTLAGGPALAAGATIGAALGSPSPAVAAAAVVAGVTSGAVGFYDDVAGNRPEQKAAKGFRGHLAALREGRVTSGLVKVAGVGAAGLAASALLARDSRQRGGVVNVLLGAGVIAGTANVINLLDLRPGRALKAGALLGTPLALGRTGALAAGPLGAGSALLPSDLGEKIMLGDAGANALGALLGLALCAKTGPAGRAFALAVLAGLTAASERVSFTQVIADTPWLRAADEWGRRPA